MGAIQDDARIGTEIAAYRIEEVLGRGGMSVVYLAEDLRLHRKVALKLITPELAKDARFRERFLAESELAASLDHPNVVPIYEAGEADGVLFIAMRYVAGKDLKQLLEDGAPAPSAAITVCAQIADALDAAHEHELVHRDVKPSNVLLDRTGHVYLADFGLTRRLADGAQFSGGLSLGTPEYVAPEQIEGKDVDGRADQYSLGCLLYECLIGQPPFARSSDAATLFAHLDEPPPSVSRQHPVLPEPVDAVIAKALAKEPGERYATCRGFIESAREALGIERPAWRRRVPLLAAIVVAVLAAAGLLTFFLVRGGTSLPPLGGGALVRIDPATSKVQATIPVGKNPSAVAVGKSGVWVADRGSGTVSRINPERNEVEFEAPANGAPGDIAVIPATAPFAAETPVVVNGPAGANLALLDGRTGAQLNVISLAPGGSTNGIAHVVAGKNRLWVAAAGRSVGHLDAGAETLADTVLIAPPPNERADSYFSGIAVGERAVWVAGDPLDSTVWRLDETTGARVATIPLPFAPKDIAAGAGGVWVTSQLDDAVSRIDPTTNEVTARIEVGQGAAGVAVGAGSVWVANEVAGTVSRIDPHTLRVETIDVEGSPEDVAFGARALWVTSHATPGSAGEPAEDTVKIGVLAACEGDFGSLYDSSLAGAELPLLRRGATRADTKAVHGVEGAKAAGKDVALFLGCTDGTAERALSEARRLVDVVGVDILIGPTWIGQAFAIRDYARTRPTITFVNGLGASQAVTLTDPAPNYFSFFTDAAQWTAGLGSYAYEKLGWRRVVTVGEATSFTYTHTAGFVAEFCALGGTVAKQIWVPEGAQDLSPYIARVPRHGVDGFVMTGFTPSILGFTKRLPQLRGNLAHRVVGGFVFGFTEVADALGTRLAGVAFVDKPGLGEPSRPAWAHYFSEYRKAFPELADFAGFPTAVAYYNSMEAVLEALEAVDGDLSNGQRRFQAALADVELDAPEGRIKLDERRQAIGSSFLIQYGLDKNGKLVWKPLRTVENVEQTFNGYFRPGDPPPGQSTIPCKHGNPPPWTRSG